MKRSQWAVMGIMVAVIMPLMIVALNSDQNLVASATSERKIPISGKVVMSSDIYDTYSIGYLHKGAAIRVVVEKPDSSLYSIFVRVVDRNSNFNISKPGWNRVYTNHRYQFIVPSSGSYMVHVWAGNAIIPLQAGNKISYKGSIVIVD